LEVTLAREVVLAVRACVSLQALRDAVPVLSTRAIRIGPRYGHARLLPNKPLSLKALFPFPQQFVTRDAAGVYTLVFKQPDVAKVMHVTESPGANVKWNGRPPSGCYAPKWRENVGADRLMSG
jgi:hypothetical protein